MADIEVTNIDTEGDTITVDVEFSAQSNFQGRTAEVNANVSSGDIPTGDAPRLTDTVFISPGQVQQRTYEFDMDGVYGSSPPSTDEVLVTIVAESDEGVGQVQERIDFSPGGGGDGGGSGELSDISISCRSDLPDEVGPDDTITATVEVDWDGFYQTPGVTFATSVGGVGTGQETVTVQDGSVVELETHVPDGHIGFGESADVVVEVVDVDTGGIGGF